MKRIILLLIFGIFLISFVGAVENCDIVWPQFGVIECDMAENTEKLEGSLSNCQQESPYWCRFSFDCAGKLHCNLFSTDFNLICDEGKWAPYLEIYKDGSITPIVYDRVPPQNIEEFQTVVIKGYCRGTILGWNKEPLKSHSKIYMTYQNKYLYDTNFDHPRHKVEESVGCVPNGIIAKEGYLNQLPENWVDSEGNIKDSKPTNAIDYLPTNMNEGETRSYLYGWRKVSGINLIKNKEDSIAGYCGGNLGDRKLLSYSKLSLTEGCYIIPISVKKNVECCYNEDCKWKGDNYICDPTTFTCSKNRPCNSDVECQVIGQTTCLNNIETSWVCDLTKPWDPYIGTCEKQTKNVLCCSDNDCGSDEYCNKELGCASTYTLENCPSGKCCFSGGNYKEKTCESDLQCCTMGGSFVGICAEDCSQISEENLEAGITGAATSEMKSGSSTGTIILIVFLVLIGGSVAYYIYSKKSKKELSRKVKQEVEIRNKKYCKKCGGPLKPKSKFCSKYGKKV